MSLCVCTHLERRALQTLYGQPEVAQQEGPGRGVMTPESREHQDGGEGINNIPCFLWKAQRWSPELTPDWTAVRGQLWNHGVVQH
jgi:hypothetical protein